MKSILGTPLMPTIEQMKQLKVNLFYSYSRAP